MKRILVTVILSCCVQILLGQGTIKTMFYNVLNYPSAPPANREKILETIIDSYEPDIFMICELETEAGGDEILNNSLNDDDTKYSSAPFLFNFSNSDIELHQLLYYNNQKFTLLQSQRLINGIRDINWYTLELITDNQINTPIRIEVFVAHLKASRGVENEVKRLDMVKKFTNNLANLNEDDYVIFAGDFNLYSSDEPAYQELLNSNNKIVMADPIKTPGDWSNDTAFTDIHTQSTRISNNEFDDFGSGGGLDDRFDFILVSENILTDTKLQYIPNTYAAYGNNGTCFNDRIDGTDCSGFYDSTLRDVLYAMSDHLPVVMELEIDQQFLSTPEFTNSLRKVRLPRGTIINDVLSVQIDNNSAPVNFKIYNTLGQEIKTFSINGLGITDISISELSSGLYYLVPLNINNNTIKFLKKR